MKTAIVIGAGFGGLSCAALLAKKGFKVTVVEKNEGPGGRARVFSEKGFLYDMGPSWYLMPEVFEKFFAEFGKKPSDYYKLAKLTPSYRMYFGKEDYTDVTSNLDENIRLFESLEMGGGKKLQEYLSKANYQYDVAMQEFIYKSYKSVFDFFNPRLAKEGLSLHLFDGFDNYVMRFFKSDKARKILEYTIVFLGANPKKTPALYSLMSHVDLNLGVWYPMGGIGELAKGMEAVGKEQGVKFVYDAPVSKILVEGGIATGVETPKGTFKADVVVSNADYSHSEMDLLDKKWRSFGKGYWDSRTVAPSGYIIYLGVKKKLKSLLHHNLILEKDWFRHFDSIFEKPEWPGAPSYYVSAPSKTDPAVAPKGHENLFILVPIAAGLEDTAQIRENYYKKILAHMEGVIGEKFQDDIVFSRTYCINDFKSDYNAIKGTALGISHTLLQTAIFRPPHQSGKVKNLYYVGGFTHPGIGVPMVIISSHIVADMIGGK